MRLMYREKNVDIQNCARRGVRLEKQSTIRHMEAKGHCGGEGGNRSLGLWRRGEMMEGSMWMEAVTVPG